MEKIKEEITADEKPELPETPEKEPELPESPEKEPELSETAEKEPEIEEDHQVDVFDPQFFSFDSMMSGKKF